MSGFQKQAIDRWIESHGGTSYDSSMVRDDPAQYDNPIGYARSYNWILRHDDDTLEISYVDGNHPSKPNEDVSGEFHGIPHCSIELRRPDSTTGWTLTGHQAQTVTIDDDELIFTPDSGETRISADLTISEPDTTELVTDEKPLNPATKYYTALSQFPTDRWLTTDEIVDTAECLTNRTDAQSVLGTLRYRGAVESRLHPDTSGRSQYRVTDHGRSELERHS